MSCGYNLDQIYDNVTTLFNFTYSIEYIFHNYVGGGYVSKFYIFTKILDLPEYSNIDLDIIQNIFIKYLENKKIKILNQNNKVIIENYLLKKIKNLKLVDINNEFILDKDKIENEEENILDLIQFKNKYLKLGKKLNYCRKNNKYLCKFHLTNLDSLYSLIYIFLPVILVSYKDRHQLMYLCKKSFNEKKIVMKKLDFYIYNNQQFYNMNFNLKLIIPENFLFNKTLEKFNNYKLEFNEKFIKKQYNLSTFIKYMENNKEFIDWIKLHNINNNTKFFFHLRELNLKNDKLIKMPNSIQNNIKFRGYKMNAMAHFEYEKFIIFLSNKSYDDLKI